MINNHVVRTIVFHGPDCSAQRLYGSLTDSKQITGRAAGFSCLCRPKKFETGGAWVKVFSLALNYIDVPYYINI